VATHDYVIANGSGAAVRSDLNGALAAIASNNSSATAPATTYAYMWWSDRTTGLLKIRDAANTAWVTVGTLASTNLGLLASAGTLTAALGSASTPSITFTGDLNTGIYSPGADQAAISTGGTERARIASTGELLVGTTTTTANGGKLQVSNGVTFPATQVACTDVNTLDDYEEGTWTPTVIGSATAGTATYTVQSARYTKIGRLVQFELFLDWNSGTGTGELRITGLPFTPASSNTYPACAIGFASNVTLTASNVPTAAVIDSPAAIWIRQTPVGGGTATNVAYDAAGTLIISGTYSV
jgi:hypothetical protein